VSDPRKVLVVRFSAIGDCVMTAFAVTAIRRQWPNAEIVWAVQREPATVVATPELVDRVAIFNRKQWKQSRWKPATWRAQLSSWLDLRKEKFDIGFDFQGHSKTAIAMRLAAPRRRYSARATDALSRALTPPVTITAEHQVDKELEFVRHAGVDQAVERPIMPDLAPEVAALRHSLGASSLVTISTGAGWPDKIYPASHWEAVAAGLIADGHTVMTLGAPGEPRLENPDVQDRVGRFSLREAMVATAASDLHLSVDTGSGHIAAAYGVPVVTLFSRHGPERYLPRGSRAEWLRAQPISEIASDDVLAKAREQLAR